MSESLKPKWELVDAEAATGDPGTQGQPKDSSGDLRDDPFGNEENAKFKYRTMKWW